MAISSSDKKAKSVSSRLEIGAIPKPKHPKRRAKCAKSLIEYARTYCTGQGGYFIIAPPNDAPRVVECYKYLQEAFSSGTSRPFHIRLGRGEGKTAIMKAAIEWAVLYGYRRFEMIVSANAAMAASLLDDIWNHLSLSPELLEDFPEVAKPIQFLDGNTRKGAFITCQGKTLKIKKTTTEMRFPSYVDEGGQIIRAVGFGAAVRGSNKGAMRPDLLLLDDIQTDEMAISAEQIEKARVLIDKGYMKLGGIKRITALMTSTAIQPNDLSEIYASNPYWKTITFPKVISFPAKWKTKDDPWLRYFELRLEDRQTGGKEAREYYRKNRKALEEGVEVFNPKYFDKTCEDSAIQRALNEYQDLGEEVFLAECQMQPLRNSAVYELTAQMVMDNANGVPSMVVPALASHRLIATIDVMNEAGLRWTIVGFGDNREAAVVAYGRYPEIGSIFNSKDSQAVQDSKVCDALGALLRLFGDLKLPVDGLDKTISIGAVGIDVGWRARSVVGVASSYSRLFPGGVWPLKGMAYHVFPRRSSGDLKAAGSEDEWVKELHSKYGSVPVLGFHSDYWRETSQRSWFVAPLQPGSLSVWGTREKHTVFANECVADRLEAVDKTRSGDKIWKWAKPSVPNHLGDCITMAFALAYWKRDYRTYKPIEMVDEGETKRNEVRRTPFVVPVF